jgi:hypothetical protein
MNVDFDFNEHNEVKHADFTLSAIIICGMNAITLIAIAITFTKLVCHFRIEMFLTLLIIVMIFGTIAHFINRIELRIMELEESIEEKKKVIEQLLKKNM